MLNFKSHVIELIGSSSEQQRGLWVRGLSSVRVIVTKHTVLERQQPDLLLNLESDQNNQ